MSELLAELMKLSPAERVQLAEALWDSALDSPDAVPPLTDEQRIEVERRLAEHLADPGSSVTWDDVRAKLVMQVR